MSTPQTVREGEALQAAMTEFGVVSSDLGGSGVTLYPDGSIEASLFDKSWVLIGTITVPPEDE